jgi:hypothetical protein
MLKKHLSKSIPKAPSNYRYNNSNKAFQPHFLQMLTTKNMVNKYLIFKYLCVFLTKL